MARLECRVVAGPGVGDISEMSLASTSVPVDFQPTKGAYVRYGKRILDILLVLLSLPIVLPIVLICALVLWFEGGAPFFCQRRLGKGGRVFMLVKLRTMVKDADRLLEEQLQRDPALRAEWQETQKLKKDCRITPIGRILRATSLDELPQFWNVLRGDMSLVGARPMMLDQQLLYGECERYFAMRPGITGPWQIGGRNMTSFKERAMMDSAYHGDISLLCDIKILLKTAVVVFRSTGY
ncbi:sugar transferase [Phaeobacter sp. HF9A]|nr:sugar transferase [Phaeobacter sp. HF9A]